MGVIHFANKKCVSPRNSNNDSSGSEQQQRLVSGFASNIVLVSQWLYTPALADKQTKSWGRQESRKGEYSHSDFLLIELSIYSCSC